MLNETDLVVSEIKGNEHFNLVSDGDEAGTGRLIQAPISSSQIPHF